MTEKVEEPDFLQDFISIAVEQFAELSPLSQSRRLVVEGRIELFLLPNVALGVGKLGEKRLVLFGLQYRERPRRLPGYVVLPTPTKSAPSASGIFGDWESACVSWAIAPVNATFTALSSPNRISLASDLFSGNVLVSALPWLDLPDLEQTSD